jgi:hypothetical protein
VLVELAGQPQQLGVRMQVDRQLLEEPVAALQPSHVLGLRIQVALLDLDAVTGVPLHQPRADIGDLALPFMLQQRV